MIEKGFARIFDNTAGGMKCKCKNKVWAFSQFFKQPALTCTNCGLTKEHGANKGIDTHGYILRKKQISDTYWQHLWEPVF